MLTPDTLLRLLAWCSPAFPTGAFAYSQGLEWAVEVGDVSNQEQLLAWLSDTLHYGSLWTDCVLMRQAMRCGTLSSLQELALTAAALAPSSERYGETLAQGAAFAKAIRAWSVFAPGVVEVVQAGWPFPVVVGAAFRSIKVDEGLGCLALLHSATANLVSTAVRLVPLGQTDGLHTICALEPVLMDVSARSSTATLDDIGTCCIRADIASMRHETQTSRLFTT